RRSVGVYAGGVRSYQRNDIALLGLSDIGDVKQHLIHADAPDLPDAFSHEQSFHSVGEPTVHAVGVTDRYGSQPGWAIRSPGQPVPHRFSLRNFLNMIDPGADR